MLEKLNLEIEDLKKLKEIDTSNNIFKILKMEDYEIRHSNVLEWLFSYKDKKSHEFNKAVFFAYIELFIGANEVGLLLNNDYIVEREQDRRDLTITFNNYIVAIENKWFATESENQLTEYGEKIKKISKETNKKYKCIYLTLTGEKPKKEEDEVIWTSSKYLDLLNIIEFNFKKYKNGKVFTEEECLIIKNYIELLKEKTMGKNTSYVKEILKFYNKNIELLEDIYKYRPNYLERANVARSVIRDFGYLTKDTSNAYVEIENLELKNYFKSLGLNENYIYTQIDIKPNTNFPKPSIVTYCLKKENDFDNNFLNAYNNKMSHLKNSRLGKDTLSRMSLLDVSEESMPESEKQFIISENIAKYLSGTYREIIEFAKNYKFK